jgi:ATP-dependent Clp protease adaptor protein ClpS
MLEAHTKGKAVVTKCHKELAELYQEGLRSEGLVATIEPD